MQSIEVQRQLVARTPVLYRLEQTDNGATSVGYVRLKEFNALARKDLLIGLFILLYRMMTVLLRITTLYPVLPFFW